MHEFAYDIKLAAVVRITACSKEDAEALLKKSLDCVDLDFTLTESGKTARITEASLSVDDEDYPFLFEVDGVETDGDDAEGA